MDIDIVNLRLKVSAACSVSELLVKGDNGRKWLHSSSRLESIDHPDLLVGEVEGNDYLNGDATGFDNLPCDQVDPVAQRIAECVTAFAGIENPAEELERLRKVESKVREHGMGSEGDSVVRLYEVKLLNGHYITTSDPDAYQCWHPVSTQWGEQIVVSILPTTISIKAVHDTTTNSIRRISW